MDLSNLDVSTASEEGAFCHLRHPVSHELLFSDHDKELPCGVFLRGAESRQVRSAAMKIERDISRRKNLGELEKTRLFAERVARAAVLRFQGFKTDGRDLESNQDDMDAFFALTDSWAAQILEFVNAPGNFLGATKTT